MSSVVQSCIVFVNVISLPPIQTNSNSRPNVVIILNYRPLMIIY